MELRFLFSLFIILAFLGFSTLFMQLQNFDTASKTLLETVRENNGGLYSLNMVEPAGN